MRTPSINWEAYKERLLHLKYEERKSLTAINKILFEELGRCVTNARLSQVFKAWKPVREGEPEVEKFLLEESQI